MSQSDTSIMMSILQDSNDSMVALGTGWYLALSMSHIEKQTQPSGNWIHFHLQVTGSGGIITSALQWTILSAQTLKSEYSLSVHNDD